jgi:hypothetical protein
VKTWIIFFVFILFLSSASALDSVRIDDAFGYHIITQLEKDLIYPCDLQPDGSVTCEAIKPELKTILEKEQDLSKGMPVKDLREQVISSYIIDGKTSTVTDYENLLKEKPIEDLKQVITPLTEPKTTYINPDREQTVKLDLSKDGTVHIGFTSNVFTITSFATGTCYNCTNQAGGIELNNHIQIIYTPKHYFSFNKGNLTDRGTLAKDLINSGCTNNYTSYIFSGTNNLKLPSTYNFSLPSTICVWNYRTDSSADRGLLGKGSTTGNIRSFRFYIDALEKLHVAIHPYGNLTLNDLSSSATLKNKRIYHLCTIINTTTIVLYINGQVDSTKPNTYAPLKSNQNISIGSVGYTGTALTFPFIGNIFDIKIWNSDLSNSQILVEFNKGLFTKYGNYTATTTDLNTTKSFTQLNWTCQYPFGSGQSNCTAKAFSSPDNVNWNTPISCTSSPCNIIQPIHCGFYRIERLQCA